MKKKNLLLIIDPQNDFVNPDGSLYVNGGEKAMKNLCDWLGKHKADIDDVIITQDTHLSFHIGHSMFWSSCPPAFTVIEPEDVIEEKITPITEDEERKIQVKEYMRDLKELGKKHTIWPEHCILGSWGWCFPGDLVNSLNSWSLHKKGKPYKVIQKGLYPWKEGYSAFTYTDKSPMSFGEELLDIIQEYDKIYLAGVAKDYCVAYSVEDLVRVGFSDRLVFLENCMATIDLENETLKIYDEAIKKGAKVDTDFA